MLRHGATAAFLHDVTPHTVVQYYIKCSWLSPSCATECRYARVSDLTLCESYSSALHHNLLQSSHHSCGGNNSAPAESHSTHTWFLSWPGVALDCSLSSYFPREPLNLTVISCWTLTNTAGLLSFWQSIMFVVSFMSMFTTISSVYHI